MESFGSGEEVEDSKLIDEVGTGSRGLACEALSALPSAPPPPVTSSCKTQFNNTDSRKPPNPQPPVLHYDT